MSDESKNRNEFERGVAAGHTGLAAEFWHFLKHTKKWWLLPIVVAVLLVGMLVILGGTAAAPFIYTLF